MPKAGYIRTWSFASFTLRLGTPLSSRCSRWCADHEHTNTPGSLFSRFAWHYGLYLHTAYCQYELSGWKRRPYPAVFTLGMYTNRAVAEMAFIVVKRLIAETMLEDIRRAHHNWLARQRYARRKEFRGRILTDIAAKRDELHERHFGVAGSAVEEREERKLILDEIFWNED